MKNIKDPTFDEARKRIEAEYALATEFIPGDEDYGDFRVVTVRCPDLGCILEALKEAEMRLEHFEESLVDEDGFCTDPNCNCHKDSQ